MPLKSQTRCDAKETVQTAATLVKVYLSPWPYAATTDYCSKFLRETISLRGFRGRIHFEFDKCILWSSVRVCPINPTRSRLGIWQSAKKEKLNHYSIDFGVCIFCGNVEFCPTNCLSMTEEYDLPPTIAMVKLQRSLAVCRPKWRIDVTASVNWSPAQRSYGTTRTAPDARRWYAARRNCTARSK